jgi:hypothetical protein
MTLEEMDEQLPNGLHDADIEEFTYDVMKNFVRFTVDVWIGSMDQPPELRERYRRGVLLFEEVQFFTKTESWYKSDGGMSFLTWKLEEDLMEKAKLGEELKGKFFSLTACYCEFRIACNNVLFEWIEEFETNRKPIKDTRIQEPNC